MEDKAKDAIELLNKHIEAKGKELQLLSQKIYRYNDCTKAEPWLKVKKGDNIKLLKIGKNTSRLDLEDVLLVRNVSFETDEKKGKIEVDVFLKKQSSKYTFSINATILTKKDLLSRIDAPYIDMTPVCRSLWNFEIVE